MGSTSENCVPLPSPAAHVAPWSTIRIPSCPGSNTQLARIQRPRSRGGSSSPHINLNNEKQLLQVTEWQHGLLWNVGEGRTTPSVAGQSAMA